jgi:hypothetical protein
MTLGPGASLSRPGLMERGSMLAPRPPRQLIQGSNKRPQSRNTVTDPYLECWISVRPLRSGWRPKRRSPLEFQGLSLERVTPFELATRTLGS